MEYRKMMLGEAFDVARLHNQLVYYIKGETDDAYFNFDELAEEDLGNMLRAFINDPVKRIYVAKDYDNITGFIAGEIINCFLPISKIAKVGYVAGAYVLPEYRGKGIMTNLEQMLTNFFKENAISYVELNVISKNLPAKRSWEGLGYTTFREQMRKKI
jgi:ribosomal protein S18 acetylase RimI-like enzyme